MSECGTFIVDRGLFGHPVFADEPFTEREAWVWMIAQAAFKPHERRVGHTRVKLSRGQFAHSIRFMAKVWQWSPSRVVRFLDRLAVETMVTFDSETDVTQITICNYEAYQSPHTKTETPAVQQRYKEEVKEVKEEKKEGVGDARARGSLISAEAHQVASECRTAVAPKIGSMIAEFCGLEYEAQVWLNRGYGAPQIVAAFMQAIARYGPDKPMSYLTKAVDGACARQRQRELPLQQVVGGTEHATVVRTRSIPAWQQRRDDWHDALAKFGAGIEAAKSASNCGSRSRGEDVLPAAAAGCS